VYQPSTPPLAPSDTRSGNVASSSSEGNREYIPNSQRVVSHTRTERKLRAGVELGRLETETRKLGTGELEGATAYRLHRVVYLYIRYPKVYETGYVNGGAELRVKSVVWTKSGIPRSNEKCLGSYEVDKEWRRSINEKVVGLGRDRRGMEGLIEAESAIVVMTQNSGNSGMGRSKVMRVQRQMQWS